MQRVHLVVFNHPLQHILRLINSGLGTHQSQTFHDPLNVGVHSHGGHPQRKAEDDACRLGPHPG